MKRAPSEGWILAGLVDGASTIDPQMPLAGMPYLARLAFDLAYAGVRTIFVVWAGADPVPELTELANDPRLAQRATVQLVSAPPAGDDSDGVVVVRADRLYHRDTPKLVIEAWTGSNARLAKLAGEEHDGVVATDRATATVLATRAPKQGGTAAELARLAVARAIVNAAPPYLAFTAAVTDAATARRAERKLVWSLRKSADGIAAKVLNRRLSLPISTMLSRTRIHPNHITLCALACALSGGVVISLGGYSCGVLGMLLVELGSIIDGIDGELARLRFQFSRSGQWLDTVVDDVANVAYLLGVIANLTAAGVEWAAPFGLSAIGAFVITQAAQYMLIATVYHSGDLAAIPWAFQSSEFLSRQPTGLAAWVRLTAPKLLKRDFVVTLCLLLAVLARLDLILLFVGSGALVFFVVFWFQFARHVGRGRDKDSSRHAFGN